MLYALRNPDGLITSLSATPADGATVVDIQDPEVLLFLSSNNESNTPLEFLEKSDSDASRILEDLIDLLINKKIILFTDLPDAAQQKLLTRKLARSAYTSTNQEQSADSLGNSILTDSDTL